MSQCIWTRPGIWEELNGSVNFFIYFDLSHFRSRFPHLHDPQMASEKLGSDVGPNRMNNLWRMVFEEKSGWGGVSFISLRSPSVCARRGVSGWECQLRFLGRRGITPSIHRRSWVSATDMSQNNAAAPFPVKNVILPAAGGSDPPGPTNKPCFHSSPFFPKRFINDCVLSAEHLFSGTISCFIERKGVPLIMLTQIIMSGVSLSTLRGWNSVSAADGGLGFELSWLLPQVEVWDLIKEIWGFNLFKTFSTQI